ncbi:PKD domain-containing protein [Marinifilum caeruleilacunae]|uniref:PKD domain-containing protein n=1 Tax=Marinifilum caeruleilacunae TaxID=2499076 RepID=A0ABX1X034_9BACT|nr:PKD domain-containing protein [Marinifilum caeruleilacunae]NOU61717.1 PKD domain-containing protein [Marinifilum caeruleilacunae]
MKNLLTILTIILFSCSLYAQNKGLTAKEQKNTGVKDIVITEKTYKDITERTLNKRKLSKIADRNSGKPKVADNPLARRLFEIEKLKNPLTGEVPANIKELERAYALSARSGLMSKTKSVGLNYTNSGPRNVGGRTRALAVDIADATGNTIIAGGVSGGMWKSTDRGQSWTRTTGLDQHPSVTAIAQDPRAGNTSTWYYTTGEYVGNSASASGAFYTGNGVFKSTDNGDTWTKLDATATNTFSSFDNLFDICWNVCVDPNNGDVYVATYGGIYVSKDGGDSWSLDIQTIDATLLADDRDYSALTDVICTPAGVKYATLSSGGNKNVGVWRKGTAVDAIWEDITPTSGFPTSYRRMVIAHAPSNTSQDIIYLLAQTSGAGLQGHSFWKLTYNGTASWEDRSQNLPEGGSGDRDVNGYNSQGSYNMVVKVAPDDENMVFIGGTNLFRSDDAFATKASPLSNGVTNNSNTYWIGGYATENNVSQYDNHHPDIHSLVFIDNTTLLCGHDGGISLTNNAKQTDDSNTGDDSKPVDWVFLNNSYLTTQPYTIAIDHDITSNKFLLAGFQDNGTWLGRDALATSDWVYWGSGDGSYASILDQGRHFLSSSQNGVVYLENDPNGPGDSFWTRVDPAGAEGQLFINPFIVDANNSEVMYYAAGQYVWRNSNIFDIPQFSSQSPTTNWEKLEISKASGTVSALESSTYPAHVLYYGTSAGKVYKIESSHNSMAKVTDITGSNMPGAYVSSIDANPLNADEVIVSFSNYKVESVFYTNDGGANWQAISGNLEDGTDSGNGPSVSAVAIMVSPTDTTYFAGTSTGLYSTSSLNGSSTVWTHDAADKIGTTVVDMIKARRDGFIAAATHGNGVFTADADYSSVAPVALIGMTADTIQAGESVKFMDRSIGDGITTYAWTFAGAETTSSNDQFPEGIVYNTPGIYDVSLTVTNATGSHTQTITGGIVIKSVEAKFSTNNTTIDVGTTVQFNNLSGSTPTSYTWSFPGGTPETSTERSPSVTYNSVGTFDVSLTVSDGTFTDTEVKTGYITVQDPNDFEDDLLYNILPENESELTQFIFTGSNDGYVTGHTNLLIDQYAEKFEITNSNLNSVKQVHIYPSVMQSNSADPSVTIKIWNGTTEPTQEVYSQVVPYSELTEDEFNIIDLDFSVAVEDNFFVGYEINYTTPIDSFAVAHLPLESDKGWDNTAYMHYNDSWSAYSDIFSGNPNTSLAIKALVGYDAGATGIDDNLGNRKVEKLLIYPNPMRDKTKVEFPNDRNQKYRLIVVDANGRVVRIIENITDNNVTINREQLKPGVHIINLTGEKIYKGKLLVK